ncbi:hypothetical protein EDB89DRAFT_26334 [Lactarius sanguifluus]|nr:hypothetical protein EDB89DRAFT_26334 [Lactarius sanguifluus]
MSILDGSRSCWFVFALFLAFLLVMATRLETEVRHPQRPSQYGQLELRGTFDPDSLILVRWTASGEATLPLNSGTFMSPTFSGYFFCPNAIAAATYNTRTRPHARHASVPCLAWTSDDPKRLRGSPILSGFADGPCDSRICFVSTTGDVVGICARSPHVRKFAGSVVHSPK